MHSVKRKSFDILFLLRICLVFFFITSSCLWQAAWAGDESNDDDSNDTFGSSTGSTEDNGASVPAPPPVKLTIVAFGDSITAGYGGPAPYSSHLRNMVGSCATIINRGEGGEFTTRGVSRISKELARYRPNYILIMEGANDAKAGISASAVKFNLGVMIDKSRAYGAVPILSTITPNTRDSGITVNFHNAAIRVLASEKKVALVDTHENVIGNWPHLTLEGLHPNSAGAIKIAEGFNGAIPCGGSSSDGDGGGGCFIATAAFGTTIEPQVVLLKQFRDQYLLTNSIGQVFVRKYYQYSPPFAGYIAQHETLRFFVRTSLYPLIGVSYLMTEASLGIRLLFGTIFLLAVLSSFFLLRRIIRKNKQLVSI